VTVSVFEDYMCPHCATFALTIAPQVKQNYVETGDVRYEFYDFPLPVSSTLSYVVAEAARSVQNNVGMDAFWEFNQLIFENQQSINRPATIYDYAEQVNADRESVQNEVRANVYRGLVEQDKETGIDQGVQGTPYVFVNGEYVENPMYNRLSERIDAALSQ
jgi:protein-disulfide isomerase